MTDSAAKPDQPGELEEPPPFFGTWRRVYLAVIAWLALLIVLFYLFAREFTP